MSSRIRMQANDFFSAYQTLKENYDSATLAVMGPSIVCLSFSIELYIKEIYLLLDLRSPHGQNGHNILMLFSNLPETIQQEIFSHIDTNIGVVRGDLSSLKRYTNAYSFFDAFIDEIKAISNGFTDWRYAHEGKRAALHYNSGFAESLVKAIKSTSDKICVQNTLA